MSEHPTERGEAVEAAPKHAEAPAEIRLRAVRQSATRHHVIIEAGGRPIYDDALNLAERGKRASFVDSAIKENSGLAACREVLSQRLEEEAMRASEAKESPSDGGDAPPGQGGELSFDEPALWSEPVDAAALLDEIRGTVRNYVVLPPHADIAVALWIVHTYLLECIDFSPRLILASAEKRSGKSRALRVIGSMVLRPLGTENVSTAALFRVVEGHKPCLLCDEGDAWLVGEHADEDRRGLLNAGCEPDGRVLRCVGEDHEPRTFSVYSAVAIGLIGRAPPTIEDRAVIVRMRRALPSERVDRLRIRRLHETAASTRSRCARWAADHQDDLREIDPELPPSLDDRAADVWRPLVAIADLAGGDWPELARRAADALTGGRDVDDSSRGTMLLRDARDVFYGRGVERISSADFVSALCRIEERPWSEWRRGRAITAAQVARLLKPYGIAPATMRLADGARLKGYERSMFADAWARYLPDRSPEPCRRDNPQSAGPGEEKHAVTEPDPSRVELRRQGRDLGDVTESRLRTPSPPGVAANRADTSADPGTSPADADRTEEATEVVW